MNLQLIKKHIFLPQSILAFEYDGFGLRAFVFKRKGKRISIKAAWESGLSDPRNALDDIMRRAVNIKPVPSKAILVTSEITPVLLELPVNPKKPRPYQQMRDLVRWEIEPFLAEQVNVRPIGSILVGKSYLKHEQAKEVVGIIEKEKDNVHQADEPVLRFGEYALKKGYINQKQLEECLSMQDRLQIIHDDPVCGWAFQKIVVQSDNKTKYKYLACGFGRSARDQWKLFLKGHKIELLGLYPLVSCSTAALNGSVSDNSAIFEIYNGLIGCSFFSSRAMDSLRLQHLSEEKVSVELCKGMIDAHLPDGQGRVNKIMFSGRDKNLGQISKELGETLGVESRFLIHPDAESAVDSIKPETLTSVAGAVSHLFRMPETKRIACIPAEDPGPPFMVRPESWMLMALLIIIGILGVVDASTQIRINLFENNKQEIMVRLDPLEKANEQILRAIDLNKELTKTLNNKKEQLKKDNEKLWIMNQLVNERPEFTLYLLKAISAAIPQHVVLEKIEESDEGIELTGWAISEEKAQKFTQSLAELMRPKDIVVGDLSVRSKSNNSGIIGYAFSFRLKPIQ